MGTVNRLLADHPGHWAFLNTWLMFAAYAALPVILFWFLDYTTALRDTSLFAALVVAVGYQQIFAGGVQGITMPGQTSRLWQPFEAWVKAVADRIGVSTRRWRENVDDEINSYVAADPLLVDRLRAITLYYSIDSTKLETELDKIGTGAKPPTMSDDAFANLLNRRRVRLLLDNLRLLLPRTFADLLCNRGIINKWIYWRWQRKSALIAWGMVTLLLVGIIFAWFCFFSPPAQTRYHQWRFLKTNDSELDRFRAREYLGNLLRKSSQTSSTEVTNILTPIATRLRYKNIPAQLAEDIERLVVDFHSPEVDRIAIPQLIEALKNENSDIRLHIQETLVALHDSDFPQTTLPDAVSTWVPKKDESVSMIAKQVASWRAWWESTGAVPTSIPKLEHSK